MDKATTLKAPAVAIGELTRFWEHYFTETPTCTNADCAEVASEVDPYFPYLDDLNRCAHHQPQRDEMETPGSLS